MDLKTKLEHLYQIYNKREYVDPDPLLFLYDYPDKKEREIAGFVASCLAYGRVEMIMKTVGGVLNKLSPSPFEYLVTRSREDMENDFRGFVYRFAKEQHLVSLLFGLKGIANRFGSIENCFCEGMETKYENISDGLAFFYSQMEGSEKAGHLMANPMKNSACKRSYLFLRWMVRKDEVDPGGWDNVSPSNLMVPLDTHMYKTGCMLGFTKRKSQDKKTAQEITWGFKKIIKQDPVKYDFCLTRFGIRRNLNMEDLKETVLK